MPRYVIYNKQNDLFWSNHHGWGDLAGADVFLEDEAQTLRLPVGGVWQRLRDPEPSRRQRVAETPARPPARPLTVPF